MKMSSRDKRALILGAAGLAAILLLRFAAIPLAESWSLAREQASDSRIQLTNLELKISRVLNQRARLEKIYGPAVNLPLQDLEAARVSLFKATQDVLKKNGFKAEDYQPQPAKRIREIPGLQLVSLQVRGKCKLNQLTKCLAGLRKVETLTIVDRLSIVNNEKKPGELEITLLLVTLAEQQGR